MSSTPNKLGANDFVAKPVSFDEFSPTVAELGIYRVLVNRAPVDGGAI